MATSKTYYAKPAQTVDFDQLMSELEVMPSATPDSESLPERSTARAAGDIALSLGQGAIGSVKSITDLAGADNPVSQGLGGMSEYLGNQKSDQSKEVLRRSQERVNAAEESGSTWEEAKAYMEMLLDQPGEFMAQGVGSFATLGLGKIAQAAKLATAAKAAGMTKGAFLATQAGKEAIKEAAKFGFKANIGVGVAQGVGAVKGSQYEQTYNNAIAQGMPEDQAQALAAEAQRYGGAGTMQQALGGALGGVAAATGPIERMVVGKGASQSGVLASMGKGLLVEGGTEGGQGAQERFAGNTAAIDSGVLAPDQRMRGVAGQGLMEGTIGGVLGAAVGPFEAQEPVAPAPAGPMTRAIAKTPGAATWSTSLGAAESAPPKVFQEDVLGKFEPEFETALGAAPEKAPGIDLPREFDTGNLSYGSSPEYGEALANPTRPVDVREFDTGTLAIDSGQTAQDQEAATAANIKQFAATQPPRAAGDAFNVIEEAKSRGLDFTVAPHPDGGFLVVPRDRVSPELAAQAESELGATIERMRKADAAPVARAPRTRSDGQELSLNTDPVAGYIEDLRNTNTPAARAYVREFDAGRVTRADVEQRMAIERGKTPDERLAEAAAEGLKLNPKNEPFKTLVAARLAAKTSPGTIIEVPGGYAIRTKPGGNAPAADQAGDWQRFSPETGTLNIPREEMPQVKNAHRGPLVNFLAARGVSHEQVEIDPAELKPSQDGFSASKVDEAADADTDRAILISSDNHIIDGHHQAVAKLKTGQPVRAIRLNAPAADLLPMVLEFPSSTTEKKTNEQDAAAQPARTQKTEPGPADVAARANGEGGPAVPQAAEELPGALINVQDAPQATTGAPTTTGAQATGAQAQADQTAAPAQGDGAAAGGVSAAPGAGDVQAAGVGAESASQPKTEKQSETNVDEGSASPQQSPEDFIPAPDGGLDYGEITPEMSKAMRRQAGKIRLQRGDESFGLQHIEERHGKEIREAGFKSVEEFVSGAVTDIESVWKPAATSQLVVIQATERGKVVFIQLQAGKDESGDFYTVRTAFPSSRSYAEKRKEWKKLWSRVPVPAADAGASASSAEPGNEAGSKSAMDSSQRSVESVPTQATKAQSTPLQQDTVQKLTPAESAELMEWQSLGTKDGVTKHILTFYRSKEDAEAKRGRMTVATVTKGDRSATAWMVDGDDQTFGPLSLAKKRGMEIGMAKAVSDGFVEAAPAQQAPQPETGAGPKDGGGAEPKRLTDAGEELIRNRRGKLKGLAWDDVSAMNDTMKVSQVVKANVWSRPDYAKLVEDGAPAWKAAALKAIYDKLAAAPVTRAAPTDADLKDYIETMHSIRDLLTAELDRVASMPDGAELWKSLKAENVFGKVFPLPADARSMFGRPSPFDRSSEQGKANNRRALLIGGNSAVQALQFDYRVLSKIKDLLAAGFPAKQEAWQKSWEVRANETRDSDVPEAERTGQPQQRFYVFEKGSRWRMAKGGQDGGYATKEQAEAFARSLTARKKEALPPSRGLDLAQAGRTGPDWRQGKDVTAQEIVDHFGFRGVNLGEYVKAKQDVAQVHLNHVFDAFSDLADLLGVPPRAMSLNGTLGVAIGAQGSGKALAHFVPGVNEINITRDSGAGALAHEFGHALDHYFATQHGRATSMAKRPYLSAVVAGLREGGGVRPEVIEAMKMVMKTINSRPMTEAEARKYMEDQRARNERYLDRWVKEFSANRGADPQALAAASEKLKRGDVGEPNGSDVETNIAEFIRAAGLKPGNSTTANAVMIAYRLRDLADEAGFLADHIPQVDTNYSKVSGEMDAKKTGEGYWGTPWEKFARAFETFVMDALKERQRQSLYLSGLVDSSSWREWSESTGKAIPYPEGDERLAMQQAFQTLADTIQTREDDAGNVAMFSRSPMKSVDANIRRGLESLAKALDERTTVHRAMFRNGLGWVDFVWGSEGTTKASGKSKGAMGLSHIMEARQRKDGLTDGEVLKLLEGIVQAIASGAETRRAEFGDSVKVIVEKNGIEAILTRKTGSNTWLVSGWNQKNPGASAAGYVASTATSSTPTTAQRGEGAGFGDIVRAAAPEVKLSRATGSPGGITKEAATQIVDAIRGRWANAPEVVVVQDMQDPAVPQRVRDADLDQRSMGAAGDPEGFWYGGKAYIVAGALSTPGDVVRVLFHEVLGHYGLRGTFGDSLAPILRQIASLRRNEIVVKAFEYGLVPKNLSPRATMQEVWAAMSDAQRLQAAEEVLAVMAQTKPEMGYVKRAIAAVRAWLRKNVPGFQDMKLTDDEIIQQFILPARRFVERGPADARARRGGSVSLPALSFSMAPQGVLDELAKLDGLFAVAKSSQKTMEGVIGELAPLWQVKKITNIPGRTQYNITTADGNTARVIERPFNPYGESIYGYDLDASGEMAGEVVGRPGDNPEDAPAADDVWIDVSLLREGGKDGELIYQAVANFAHNTGKVFIGDPAGLSDQALRRRTEQMLSSALKHGTTRHIAPHPRQVSGDAKLGVPGLKWVYGDDIGNVERMIDVSLKSLENAFPSAKLIGYDSATNQFYRTDTGQRFANRGQLARVVGQSIESRLRLAGRKGGQGEAGWRTIARGALFNDLKAAMAVESTSRDRGSVLGGLREVGARLERDGATGEAYPAQERIFYSRRRDGLTSEDGAALFSRSADAPNDPRALVDRIRQFDVSGKPANTLKHYRGMALRTLGRRQLVDLFSNELPQLETYNDLVQAMDAEKNDTGAEADRLARDWGNLDRDTKKPGEERRLAELMHDATLAQIDPQKEYQKGDNRAQWASLRNKFSALDQKSQDLYVQARDMYADHYAKVRQAISDRIERSELSASQKKVMMARMDEDFFKKTKGVYFPLARFGSYVMVVKDANGEVVNVSRAETLNEAETTRKELLNIFPKGDGFRVSKVLKDAEFNPGRDAVGKGFMADLFEVLDKQGADDALRDSVSQLYLSALPDLSWAKHGIHRKGTPGFSQDARRAFAQNMFHGARYLAKLRYADKLQTQLEMMQENIKAYSEIEEYDSVKAQQVLDEMVKRHENLMNPKTNALSTALTSIGFVFYLGVSPAAAMVNLSQTALVAYPIMGAKWGFDKAGAALLKASKETVLAKNDISKILKGDELAAYEQAVKDGTIDVTMAHDLAGISQGEDAKVSWAMRPVMRWASFLFHHAERFNRQATFIAAFRLSKAAGSDNKAAFIEAKQATYDGHFDYSASNRPRIMQGNVAKVVTLFKQYGQNMIYTLSRQAYLSMKGLTPEERTEARKQLGGILALHAAAAGAMGLPLVGPLLAIASFLGGDDDEPWDAEVAMKNMMADALGPKAAEVISHGLSRLTPWDISGRVALDRLILPDVREGLEGQDWAESMMVAAIGPVGTIFTGAAKGLQSMSEGRYGRGLEEMMPVAVRNVLKAVRFADEGALDKSGIVIRDEVSLAGVLGQASGFAPSDVRLATEGKSAIIQFDQARLDRRRALLAQFAQAQMAGDPEGVQEAREAIARFNSKNPTRRIKPENLRQSVRNRVRRIEEAEQGVYLPKNRRDAMEAGRFALDAV